MKNNPENPHNTHPHKPHKAGLFVLAAVWISLSVWCFIKQPEEFSLSERRALKQFPKGSLEKIVNGSFMSEFEDYALDQFPQRDTFRMIKSISSMYVFGKKDNNGIYMADGYASKLEYPLNESSVKGAADKITGLYNRYIKDTDCRTYISIVPDKNYFLAAPNNYPAMDYERLFSLIKENTPYAEYIDITDTLEIDDYYKTDTHWKQENITDAAGRILEAMGRSRLTDYNTVDTGIEFYGVYLGQSALPLGSESMKYVTNDIIADCKVTISGGTAAENVSGIKEYFGMYDMDRLSGRDPYEMYLSGAVPVIYIDNPNAGNDKQLIVFRDSFGSSLVPLISHEYRKVTVLDTRYITPDLIGEFAEFDNADVLFVYSTLLINQSMSMRDFYK